MPPKKKKERIVTIHNKISPNFKSIHVDGAYGGITTSGYVNMNFFAERGPIPKSSDFRIDLEKENIEKISDSEDSKDGIIREYDFGIYMSVDTTKRLIKLLMSKISEYENIIKP